MTKNRRALLKAGVLLTTEILAVEENHNSVAQTKCCRSKTFFLWRETQRVFSAQWALNTLSVLTLRRPCDGQAHGHGPSVLT